MIISLGIIRALGLLAIVRLSMDESYKHLGPLAIGTTWLWLSFLVYRWRGNKAMSFSQHAAAHDVSHFIHVIVCFFVLPIFYLFVAKYFVPKFDLPSVFTYLALLGVLGQLVGALVPDRGGRKTHIHNLGSYGMAALMIPLNVL